MKTVFSFLPMETGKIAISFGDWAAASRHMVQLFHFERCGVDGGKAAAASGSASHFHACGGGEYNSNSNSEGDDFEIVGWQPQPFHVTVNYAHAQLQHQEASLLLSLAYCMLGRVDTGAKILNRLIKMLEADRTSHIHELHHPTDFWLSLSYYHLAICQQQQQQESGTVEVDVLDNSANKARMESPCPSLHQSLRRGSGVENAEAGHLKTVRNLLSQICQE